MACFLAWILTGILGLQWVDLGEFVNGSLRKSFAIQSLAIRLVKIVNGCPVGLRLLGANADSRIGCRFNSC
jgi:hypothetical protein